MNAPLVLKVGGQELDSPAFLAGLAQVVTALPAPPVIVHGGGKGSTRLADRLGLETRFIDGRRVTDDATLEIAVMGLVGQASTQLVQGLVTGGVRAIGLSGVDAGLVTVAPAAPRDLGWVGEPSTVRHEVLHDLVKAGFVPCLAPISLGDDGCVYNVNADTVAAAIAAALGAPALVMLTAAPGVLRDGQIIPTLTPHRIERLITDGVIRDGMIPKTRAACAALARGVRSTRIIDLAGLTAWVADRETPQGTEVRPE